MSLAKKQIDLFGPRGRQESKRNNYWKDRLGSELYGDLPIWTEIRHLYVDDSALPSARAVRKPGNQHVYDRPPPAFLQRKVARQWIHDHTVKFGCHWWYQNRDSGTGQEFLHVLLEEAAKFNSRVLGGRCSPGDESSAAKCARKFVLTKMGDPHEHFEHCSANGKKSGAARREPNIDRDRLICQLKQQLDMKPADIGKEVGLSRGGVEHVLRREGLLKSLKERRKQRNN